MRDDDVLRYVVIVKAFGVDTVHTVYREPEPAHTEAARLRACGFEARVGEGRPPPAQTFNRWGNKRDRRA